MAQEPERSEPTEGSQSDGVVAIDGEIIFNHKRGNECRKYYDYRHEMHEEKKAIG